MEKSSARAHRTGNGRSVTGSAAGEVETSSSPASSASAEVISSADLRELLAALQAVKIGDFSVRLPGDRVGIFGKISDAFNDIVADNQRMAIELERVGDAVGREGRTRQRVKFS